MADAKVTLDGDSAQLRRELKKAGRDIDKLKDKLARLGRESKKTARKSKSMADGFSSQFRQMATGALSVAAAVGIITTALQRMNAERQKARQGLTQAAGGIGQLGQLAITGGRFDPQKFQGLISSAQAISAAGGQDPGAATALQFALTSGGLAGERDLFAKLRFITPNVPGLTANIAGFQAALGPRAGSARQILSQALVASGRTKTNISQILATALEPAQEAAAIGTTPSELMALTAVLTRATRSPEIAGTQIKALAGFIGTKGLGGQGIIAALPEIGLKAQEQLKKRMINDLENLRAKTPTQAEAITKYIGNIRARSGFRGILRQIDEARGLQTQLITAGAAARQGPGLIGEVISGVENAPQLRSELNRQNAESMRKWGALNTLGPVEAARQETVERFGAAALKSPLGPISRMAGNIGAEFAAWLGLPPGPAILAAGATAAVAAGVLTAPLDIPLGLMEKHLSEMNKQRPLVSDPNEPGITE